MTEQPRCQFCGDSRVIGRTLAVAAIGAPVFVDRPPDLLPRHERRWVCAACFESGGVLMRIVIDAEHEGWET